MSSKAKSISWDTLSWFPSTNSLLKTFRASALAERLWTDPLTQWKQAEIREDRGQNNLFERQLQLVSRNQSDPYVFGPPGSGPDPFSQRYGSASGSFYHQAKIVRKKTLILTVLWLLFGILSLKNYVTVTSKNIKQKHFFNKISFLLAS